jgi:hypothetical protein
MKETIKNVDVNLMLKIMYLERKLPGVAPHIDLELKLKPGINRVKQEAHVRSKYGFKLHLLVSMVCKLLKYLFGKA